MSLLKEWNDNSKLISFIRGLREQASQMFVKNNRGTGDLDL